MLRAKPTLFAVVQHRARGIAESAAPSADSEGSPTADYTNGSRSLLRGYRTPKQADRREAALRSLRGPLHANATYCPKAERSYTGELGQHVGNVWGSPAQQVLAQAPPSTSTFVRATIGGHGTYAPRCASGRRANRAPARVGPNVVMGGMCSSEAIRFAWITTISHVVALTVRSVT